MRDQGQEFDDAAHREDESTPARSASEGTLPWQTTGKIPRWRFGLVSRLRLIGLTYVTRPILWALLVLAVLFGWLDWAVSHDTRNTEIAYPMWPKSLVERIDFPQDLERVRATKRENDVEAIRLSQLWPLRNEKTSTKAGTPRTITAPSEEFYKLLDEFPHLKAVNYYGWPGSEAGLEKVLHLPGLEYLQLGGTCTFDMARLASARNIRYLTFSTYQPPQNIAALAALPHLETIVFDSRLAIDDSVLAELAKLPQLKTLVLDLSPSGPADKPLTAAGFDALRSSPSLENLYVGGWQQEITDQYLPLAMPLWPKISVNQARVHLFSFLPEFVRVMPFLMLAGMIGLQLSSQFRSSLRKLAPRFARDQALVAITLALLVTVAYATRLVFAGALPGAAFMVATLFVMLAMSVTAFSSVQREVSSLSCQSTMMSTPSPWRSSAGSPQLLRWLSGYSAIVQFGLIAALFAPTWMGYVLRSGDYRVMLALALAIVPALNLLAQSFQQLVYWGATADPRLGKSLPANAGYRESWQYAGAEHESRIEALAHKRTADMSWWQRVDRWRLANVPVRILKTTAIMFVACLVGQWIMTVKLLRTHDMSDGGRSFVSFAAMFALIQPGIQLATVWRWRLRALSIESTRPYTRDSLRYEWMAAFLADLLPSVVLVSVLAAIGVNWHPPYTITWHEVPLSLLQLFPTALAASAAAAALGAVIERGWVATLLGAAMFMALVFVTTMVVFVDEELIRHVRTAPRDMPNVLLTHAWAAGVVAAIVVAVIARRFFRMEVGSRT